jgi:hypothetical protein
MAGCEPLRAWGLFEGHYCPANRNPVEAKHLDLSPICSPETTMTLNGSMICRKAILAIGLALASCAPLRSQALPESRWPEGFTKANPEHMVIYETDPVCLKRLRGSVQVPAEKTEVPGRAGVLIEVKPDRATGPLRIWQTTSKRKRQVSDHRARQRSLHHEGHSRRISVGVPASANLVRVPFR